MTCGDDDPMDDALRRLAALYDRVEPSEELLQRLAAIGEETSPSLKARIARLCRRVAGKVPRVDDLAGMVRLDDHQLDAMAAGVSQPTSPALPGATETASIPGDHPDDREDEHE